VRVTTVIPAYNSARVIGRAIDSALRQSTPPFEIIVVDDGSTDGTGAVAAAYGPPVRVLQQANAGAAAARNAGVAQARGDLIAFLDADDEWLPGKLEAQVAHMEAHPQTALVGTATRMVDREGKLVLITMERGVLAQRVPELMMYRNMIQTSSAVVRTSAVRQLDGPFHTGLAPIEDWHLWIRMAVRWPISVLPDIHIVYHVLESSLTRTCPPDVFRDRYTALYRSLERDPVVAPLLRDRRRRLRANIRMMVGHHMYGRGHEWRARREILSAIATSPLTVKWSTALPLLLLPATLRDRLRRAVTVARRGVWRG
jgi:glycosyltransferase involved in cell wall biosynthesis